MGSYLNNYDLEEKTKRSVYILAVLSLIGTIIIYSVWSVKTNTPIESLYGYLLPNTFFVSTAVFILFKEKFSKIGYKKYTILRIQHLSTLTFGMYLVHDFFNMILLKIGLTSVVFNPIFSVPIITFIIFTCSFIEAFVINKIPVLNKYIL